MRRKTVSKRQKLVSEADAHRRQPVWKQRTQCLNSFLIVLRVTGPVGEKQTVRLAGEQLFRGDVKGKQDDSAAARDKRTQNIFLAAEIQHRDGETAVIRSCACDFTRRYGRDGPGNAEL